MTPTQGPSGGAQPLPKISGYKSAQMPNFTPEMFELFNKLLGGISGGVGGATDFLSKLAGGDEGMFEQLERPAMRNFEKFLGQAGTRFSHLGAGDSSYFENAIAGEGADMAERLQSQRLGLQQQAVQSLLGNSQTLLGQQPYQNFLQPKEKKQDMFGGGDIASMFGAALKFLPFLL